MEKLSYEEYVKFLLERDKIVKPLISYGTFSKYSCFICGDDIWEKDNFCRNCGQRVKELLVIKQVTNNEF